MSGRGATNLLTRTTAILAACFFATSIALAVLASQSHRQQSILDATPQPTAPGVPATSTPPVAPAPVEPPKPAEPQVPQSK
jgi:preprotein translocase subunit SecG